MNRLNKVIDGVLYGVLFSSLWDGNEVGGDCFVPRNDGVSCNDGLPPNDAGDCFVPRNDAVPRNDVVAGNDGASTEAELASAWLPVPDIDAWFRSVRQKAAGWKLPALLNLGSANENDAAGNCASWCIYGILVSAVSCLVLPNRRFLQTERKFWNKAVSMVTALATTTRVVTHKRSNGGIKDDLGLLYILECSS